MPPDLTRGPKPMVTKFGIHHPFESCVSLQTNNRVAMQQCLFIMIFNPSFVLSQEHHTLLPLGYYLWGIGNVVMAIALSRNLYSCFPITDLIMQLCSLRSS